MIWFIGIGLLLWALGALDDDLEERTARRRAHDPSWEEKKPIGFNCTKRPS